MNDTGLVEKDHYIEYSQYFVQQWYVIPYFR
jgi:hypothetical protein